MVMARIAMGQGKHARDVKERPFGVSLRIALRGGRATACSSAAQGAIAWLFREDLGVIHVR
jgi:hypothetical protein